MDKKPLYLTVNDHSVSGEIFQLVHDDRYDMLVTQPQFSGNELMRYYNSEEYISHTDGKRNLFERTYQFIKGFSLKRKVKLINSFSASKEKSLLDIGCGTGDFIKVAQKKGWQVLGIEPNERARALANQKTNNCVLDTDGLLGLKPQSFDAITLWHVLEHLPDFKEQIAICKKLLKPGGRLVVAVPNFKSYDAKHYGKFWAAYDAPRHLWHFSKPSIQKIMLESGLNVDRILPLSFDAFYVSLLSEKYKSGWMNPFKATAVGLFSNVKAMFSGEYSSLIYIIKTHKN